jgi:hypothetical protein
MRAGWILMMAALICAPALNGVFYSIGNSDWLPQCELPADAANCPFLPTLNPEQGSIVKADIASEFIFTTTPFPSCHASTIVELRDGNLLAAWFGGTAESRPDVAVWGARRAQNQWSIPFERAREPNIAAYNPVLFFTPDSRLWLYFKFGPNPREWTGR